jgi:hypothetical protein
LPIRNAMLTQIPALMRGVAPPVRGSRLIGR